MDTSLARQLQQAWLETQVRKQSSDFSYSSSDHGPVSSSSSQQTSSSWPMSPDPGAETSFISALPGQGHTLDDEEPFHDPVLQYINDMLMDEDLEDRKCMYAECMSYVKQFYDILGSNEDVPCTGTGTTGPAEEEGFACKEESSALTEGDTYQDGSFIYNDNVGLGVIPTSGVAQYEVLAPDDGGGGVNIYAHTTEPLKFLAKTEHHLRVPPFEVENVLNSSEEEHKWVDDLLSNIGAIASQQDAMADVIPSPAVSGIYPALSESGSTYLSPQQSFGGVSVYEQELPKLDSFSPSSVLPVATTPNLPNGDELHNFTVGCKERDLSRADDREKFFSRSSSDTSQNLPTSNALVSTERRFKRAATEVDAAIVSQSISLFSSAGSSVTSDVMGEESFSFVRNEHLNAEQCASILNDGLASGNGMCYKSSSASIREGGGRAPIIVSTVADLKGLLTSCAQAVASNNLRRAQEILQEIRQDASPYGSGLQRLAHYFAEGLFARLSGTGDRLYSVFTNNSPSAARMLKAHQLFVKVCPFVTVSHFFANRAILEAAKGASRLHIVDYGILYGLQWPCLISALAERKGGPPILRITGIDFPQPGYAHAERVEITGKHLAEYAKTYGVPFEYHAIASRWELVHPSSLNLRRDEVVIVNSMHRLHHLLDETVLASNPRKTVLSKMNEIKPKIFVQGIKNGNYNAPFFMSRFKEALASFSGAFDMLEALIRADNQERMMIEREVLGRDILNVVACEGPERVERPETYRQWQNRTQRAGFVQLPLHRKALNESQTIVRCGYSKNFSVDEDGSWMLLCWKGKVAHGLSLWKPAGR
ncbi:hypothetical protein GOP47_0003535 [Adiantum capillus-veneris]|uniref:Uncharacterized protein n=1 Tax=Adiantum capillus-veneris TaxID=13818 RepID=A0A9D4VCN1_ADICA|nr:hypothetical protein GOP47_0003535 [Adiantum capillus-veneris]